MFYVLLNNNELLFYQVACAINKHSPSVVNDLMAHIKIGTGNAVGNIGFRIPINVLQKHSGENRNSVLNNIIFSQNTLTKTDSNQQNVIINLNKFDFINAVLKNDMIEKIPQPHLQSSKPRIIEFR